MTLTETAAAADRFIQRNWDDGMVLTVAHMLDVEPEIPFHEWEVRIYTDWGQECGASEDGPAEYGCQGDYEVYDDRGEMVACGTFGSDGPEGLSLVKLVG
jgi:hypothetical protein